MRGDPEGSPPRRWRTEGRALVELFALCGFAITQPLLEIFGRGFEQFALRSASAGQIIGFAVGITVLPTVALWLGEVIVGMVSGRIRGAAHLAVVLALASAVAVQVLRPLVTGVPLAALAVAVGSLAAIGYHRIAAVRLWLAFAALAPIAFLGWFLVGSPTSDVLSEEAAPVAEVPVGRPAPVVMLVLDELPLESLLRADGTLDAELFPNLADLAGDSHWFRNTTTVTSTTWNAVPAIVTGQAPRAGTGPTYSSHPDNLFTLLAGAYEMRVTETISRMCPSTLCEVTASNASVWRGLTGDAVRVMRSRLSPSRAADDPVTGFADLSAARDEEPVFADLEISQPDRFRSLIEDLGSDELALHYLHILLPHVPYRHLPSGNVYEGPIPDLGRLVKLDQWGKESWPVTLGRQRHLLQLGYVDSLIGVLLAELKATGLYDEALVVVTADHGISFQPGGPIRAIEGQVLDRNSAPDILWVPLFVKEPHQSVGEISDANVLSIDILPTIADVLDIDIPFAVDGRSALGPPRTTTDKPYYGNDVTPLGVAVADPVTIDGPTGWAAVLERSVGRFLPSVGDRWRLWRTGPSASLVGKDVGALTPRELVEADVTLTDPGAFDDVPESGTVPVLVRGRADGVAVGTPLAIAVNGVVAATGPVYRDGTDAAFAVMVDETLFIEGSNEVRVYEVR